MVQFTMDLNKEQHNAVQYIYTFTCKYYSVFITHAHVHVHVIIAN